MGASSPIPQVLGIIPDGNRRWARTRGLPPAEGHRAGARKVGDVVRWAREVGVRTLVLYTFSTENWGREGRERHGLWRIVRDALARARREGWAGEGVRVQVVGQRERLPPAVRGAVEEVERATARERAFTLILALSYGGRWEIVEAARRLAERGGPWTERAFERALPMGRRGVGAVDLVIRTGGERRLSNFLLWEVAYAPLAFTATLWPDFSREEFLATLQWYAQQEQRRGR